MNKKNGKQPSKHLAREKDEPTLSYRKRLSPSYKAGRRERAAIRREKLAERKAEREWQRILDIC